MSKPLQGLKVIDLTTALNGPFCTMTLADYGAEVIKVEPVNGEQCRTGGHWMRKAERAASLRRSTETKRAPR